MAGKNTVAIVTACMNANGTPTFVLNEVDASQEEIDNGIHYYLAEAQLMEEGYEEPYVHFDEHEAPRFLHPIVREYINEPNPVNQFPV